MKPEVYREMGEQTADSWYYRGKHAAVLAMMDAVDLRPRHIIDVGCGTGIHAEILARRAEPGATYIGIEPEELPFRVSSFSSARIIREPLERAVETLVGTSADMVVALDVLEHLADENRALSAMKKLLAPGGFLLLTVPAYPFLWTRKDDDVGHRTRYTAPSLEDAVRKSGMQIVRWNHYFAFAFLPLAVQAVIERIIPKRPAGRDAYFGPFPTSSAVGFLAEVEGRLGRVIHWPIGTGIVCLVQVHHETKT